MVGGVENQLGLSVSCQSAVSDGRQRELCQAIESFNGLCFLGTRFVWQTKSACVGWACNVGSLELYSIQNGSPLTSMQ